MSSLPSRRTLRDGALLTGVAGGWILLCALLTAAVVGILWGIGVFASGPAGAGQVHKDRNSASNREHWSSAFNGEYRQIEADRGNLAVLRAAADAPGATRQDVMDYTGAQLNCRSDVAAYNADAGNTLARPWIPAGLPTTIPATTYCGADPR